MDGEDFEFEELLISEAVGASFEGFDFVVGPLQRAGRDRVVVPGEDALAVDGEGPGEAFDDGDPAGFRSGNPVPQKPLGGLLGRLLPDLP